MGFVKANPLCCHFFKKYKISYFYAFKFGNSHGIFSRDTTEFKTLYALFSRFMTHFDHHEFCPSKRKGECDL